MDDLLEISSNLISDKKVSNRFRIHLIEFLHEAYGIRSSQIEPDLTCFVNAQSNTYSYLGNSEPNNICGAIQLSPGRTGNRGGKRVTIKKVPDCKQVKMSESRLLYDSLAFTDVLTNSRVNPEEALLRQLSTLEKLDNPKEVMIVSYDRLIDEKFVNGVRKKQRWTVKEGEQALIETIDAASYLNNQRDKLKDYTLVQSCQGVDAQQYVKCVKSVLRYCKPNDVIGLGGWCILGRQPKYLEAFWETINEVIPLVAQAGIKKVHIFGVTWYKKRGSFVPPLPPLLWLCDRHNIKLSTDGTSPIGNALWKDTKRSGADFPYWRHNLAWVKARLATLREVDSYQNPQRVVKLHTQMSLF